MPWYLSKWFGCHLWGAVIDNRVSLGIWWPRSLAWEHNLTHKNISYFPGTSALGVFLTRQHCQWGNGGSGTVIHIIWISLWFLTFGPHNKSSVGYHCRENGETETVVKKLHVFKHTHCNVLMNSHSHVKTKRETDISADRCRYSKELYVVLENVLGMESQYRLWLDKKCVFNKKECKHLWEYAFCALWSAKAF